MDIIDRALREVLRNPTTGSPSITPGDEAPYRQSQQVGGLQPRPAILGPAEPPTVGPGIQPNKWQFMSPAMKTKVAEPPAGPIDNIEEESRYFGKAGSDMMQKRRIVELAAKAEGVDPDTLWSIMLRESGGDENAVNPSGAKGAFQLMPNTQKDAGVTDPFNFEESAHGAARYINRFIRPKVGDNPRDIALAYHGGPTAAAAYQSSLGPFEPNPEQVRVSEKYIGPKTTAYADRVAETYAGLQKPTEQGTAVAAERPQRDEIDVALEQALARRRQKGLTGDFRPTRVQSTANVPKDLGFIPHVKESWEVGKINTELAGLGWQQMMGDNSTETEQRIQELTASIPKGYAERKEAAPWYTQAVGGAAETTPLWLSTAKYGGYGAVGAGALSALLGPEAIPAGMAAGFYAGSIGEITKLETGLSYLALKDLKDENGNSLDPTLTKVAAAIAGAGKGILEMAQIKAFMKLVPGGEKAVTGVVSKALKNLFAKKTFTNAVLKAGAKWGAVTSEQVVQELFQEGTDILAEEVAKELNDTLQGTGFAPPDVLQIQERLYQTGKQSFLAFGAMGVLPATAGAVVDMTGKSPTKAPSEVSGVIGKKPVEEPYRAPPDDIIRSEMSAIQGQPELPPEGQIAIPTPERQQQQPYVPEQVSPQSRPIPQTERRNLAEEIRVRKQAVPEAPAPVVSETIEPTPMPDQRPEQAVEPAVVAPEARPIVIRKKDGKPFKSEASAKLNKEVRSAVADEAKDVQFKAVDGGVVVEIRPVEREPAVPTEPIPTLPEAVEEDRVLSVPTRPGLGVRPEPVKSPKKTLKKKAKAEPEVTAELKPGTQKFVDKKVEKLGSVNAVDEFYASDADVDKYARAKAREMFGEQPPAPAEGAAPIEEPTSIVPIQEGPRQPGLEPMAEVPQKPPSDRVSATETAQKNEWVVEPTLEVVTPETGEEGKGADKQPRTAEIGEEFDFYHTSPEPIGEINDLGLFGSMLFFSPERGQHGTVSPNETTYGLNLKESDIVEANHLAYEKPNKKMKEVIREVADEMQVDEEMAIDLISERKHIGEIDVPAHMDENEADWWIQKKTGEAAKALGYRGVEVTDEHGSSYLIDMKGREGDLAEYGLEPAPAKVSPKPSFSYAETARPDTQAPITKANVEQTVAPVTAKWKNAPPGGIKVVQFVNELPSHVRSAATKQNVDLIRGAFDGETAWLVADNLKNANEAHNVLFHEVVGHYGIEALLGDDLRPILRNVAKTQNLASESEAAEYIADLAMTNENPGLLKRVVAVIRAWARKMGFRIKMTDNDILNLVAQSRRFVETGKRGTLGTVGPNAQFSFAGIDPSASSEELITKDARETVRFSLMPQAYTLNPETRAQRFQRKIQDDFNRVRQLQSEIAKAGGDIREGTDPSQAATLWQGLALKERKAFYDGFVQPLVNQVAQEGVTEAQVQNYVYARHAPERNAHVQSINPKFKEQGGGSGMLDDQARGILQFFADEGLTEKLDRVAEKFDALTREGRRILRESGLMDSDTMDAIDNAYEFYAPLKGLGDNDKMPSVGKKFDIRGEETKRALGRESLAKDLIANAIAQIEATIIRSNKNKVSQEFYTMMEENPNDDIATLVKPMPEETKKAIAGLKKDKTEMQADPELPSPYKRYVANNINKTISYLEGQHGVAKKQAFDEKTGEVVWRSDPMQRRAPNVLGIKFDGEQHYAIIHDEALAKGLTGLGVNSTSAITRMVGKVNRMLAKLITTFNPEFVLSNFARDMQTAGLNLTVEDSAKMAAKVWKDVISGKAIKAAWKGLRDSEATTEWDHLFKEYQESGAPIAFMGLDNIETTRKNFTSMLRESKGGWSGNLQKFGKGFVGLITTANNTIENATRFSAYVHARRAGATVRQAAVMAKNLTVNFERKGEWGNAMNAWFMFSNASVQGTARLIQVMKTNPVKFFSMVGSVAIASFLMSQLNRAMGGEDDDGKAFYDKVPGWIKENNFVIMRPNGKRIQIPLPYGYNVFHAIGMGVDAMINNKDPLVGAASIVHSMMESFSPMGTAPNALQFISPTITDPFIQIGMNESFFGGPIKPEQPAFSPPKPESELYFRSVNPHLKDFASWLNQFSGGNPAKPGLISVSPETMEHFFNFFTGGAGAFVQRSINFVEASVKGEDVPIHKIPFARRVYGEQVEWLANKEFYEYRDDIALKQEELEYFQKTHNPKGLAAFMKENRGVVALYKPSQKLARTLSKLRKQKRAVEAGSQPKTEKKERIDRIDARIRKLQVQFNRRYLKAIDSKGPE